MLSYNKISSPSPKSGRLELIERSPFKYASRPDAHTEWSRYQNVKDFEAVALVEIHQNPALQDERESGRLNFEIGTRIGSWLIQVRVL